MRAFAADVLDAAVRAGAGYADVRITDTRTQKISVRNGVVEGVESSTSLGFGVRVIADGAWGFAAAADLDAETAERVARQAVAIARASATVGGHRVRLSDVPAVDDSWSGPCAIDPFTVSVEDKIALLLDADAAKRKENLKTVTEGLALGRAEMSAALLKANACPLPSVTPRVSPGRGLT